MEQEINFLTETVMQDIIDQEEIQLQLHQQNELPEKNAQLVLQCQLNVQRELILQQQEQQLEILVLQENIACWELILL